MEMAANVRSVRVICSPEREEDVAAAREWLHPPRRPVSPLSHLPWLWDALAACLLTFPSTTGSRGYHTRAGELTSMLLGTFQISREEQ